MSAHVVENTFFHFALKLVPLSGLVIDPLKCQKKRISITYRAVFTDTDQCLYRLLIYDPLKAPPTSACLPCHKRPAPFNSKSKVFPGFVELSISLLQGS